MALPGSLCALYELIVCNSSDSLVLDIALEEYSSLGTGDALIVARTAAMARNYGGVALTRPDQEHKKEVLDFIIRVETLMIPHATTMRNLCLGIEVYNKRKYKKALRSIRVALGDLEDPLMEKTFLLGEDMSFADLCLFCVLFDLFVLFLHPELRKSWPYVIRWFQMILNQPEAQNILGSVNLCLKPVEFLLPTKLSVKGDGGVCDEGQNPLEGDGAREKDGELNPSANCSPPRRKMRSRFRMTKFKHRLYEAGPAEAIKYFRRRFDPINFSIWFCEYRLPGNTHPTPVSFDMIHDMVCRLNPSWPETIGSMCLFGENELCAISGVWIVDRQRRIFNEESLRCDSGSFHWRELDLEDAPTKILLG